MSKNEIETKYVDEIGKNLIVCPNCGSTKNIIMDGVFVDRPGEYIAVELNRKASIEYEMGNVKSGEMNLTFCFKCHTCHYYFAYILESSDNHVKVEIDTENLENTFDVDDLDEDMLSKLL